MKVIIALGAFLISSSVFANTVSLYQITVHPDKGGCMTIKSDGPFSIATCEVVKRQKEHFDRTNIVRLTEQKMVTNTYFSSDRTYICSPLAQKAIEDDNSMCPKN